MAASAIGCGAADSEKEIETLGSWRATTEMAIHARDFGWVTPRYAAQVHDRAQSALNATREAVDSDRGLSTSERTAIATSMRKLQHAIDSLAGGQPR